MHQITIEPWTQYDDQRRPWWPVSIVGTCGRFALAWTSADGGRWAESNELRRLKNSNGRLLHCAEEQVRTSLCRVTEKTSDVTKVELVVTDSDVTSSRAHTLPLEGKSQPSRVTCDVVTVTDERDSDSHSPPVRDHHHHTGDASQNLTAHFCSGHCGSMGTGCWYCDGRPVEAPKAERRIVSGGQIVVGIALGLVAWAFIVGIGRVIAGGAL